MSRHGTIRRYSLIIEKTGRKLFPSFEEIKTYLHDRGFEVSTRTIQRDIEQIRYEFGVEIAYDRYRNGYTIDTEHSIDIPSFLRFLEIVNTAQLLTESLKESRDSLDHIMFESDGGFRGTEHLKPLLGAIRDRRRVTFRYFKFSNPEQADDYLVDPYLLKEYQNRWYVVGISESANDFRIFGLDRIGNLQLLDDTFERQAGFQARELFDHTIGLTYNAGEPREIILSFTPLQGKYIKTLPLHHSQEVLIDNAHELRVSLYVNPNYEFRQKILMLGDTVKVLEPAWLADEIHSTLKKAAGRYQ